MAMLRSLGGTSFTSPIMMSPPLISSSPAIMPSVVLATAEADQHDELLVRDIEVDAHCEVSS
jgi:hypothetical protein